MKKFIMLAATVALILTSCSDDDNFNISDANLTYGAWIEIAPNEGLRSLSFNDTVVTAARQDGLVREWEYTIENNKLYFGEPEEHTVEVLDSNNIKVSNIYIMGDAEDGIPQTVTFKRVTATTW
jgi:hypothetical protein